MIATTLAAAVRLVCGPTVRWHCEPRSVRQRIYFANHASHLDFLLIWSAFPASQRRSLRPVAGRDYWEGSSMRRLLAARVFHAVLIDRACQSADRKAAAGASIRRMADEMGGQHSLIVFPEGTRGGDVVPSAFKSGLYHLHRLRPDVELIPVYLDNLNRILPKGESLPVPMLSRVVFGPPFAARADEDKPAFLARARDALIQLRTLR